MCLYIPYPLQLRQIKSKSKSKEGYSSLQASLSSPLYGNSHAIWDHTVLPATRHEVTFPPLPQLKLVLDLATPEGCKAELTQAVG